MLSSSLLILLYKTQSSANRFIFVVMLLGRSLRYIKKKMGDRLRSYGTLDVTFVSGDSMLSISVHSWLEEGKLEIQDNTRRLRLSKAGFERSCQKGS